MTDPSGRVGAPCALVTGAARRIGRAVALALARAGHDVAVHHRGPGPDADAERLAEEIRALGRRAVVLSADLADEDAVRGLVPAAAAALGPLSLLVNNASVFEDDRVGGLGRETWDRHFQVNLRAPVVLTETFAAQAGQGGAPRTGAAVVNLLDQRVLKPDPRFFSYGLSRSTLWTATRTLAQALAPRVRVNAVGPGPTLASIHQSPDEFAAEAAGTPLGRPVEPDAVASAVVWLAQAEFVTGQMIAVDSGQHLGWKTPDITDAS